MSGAIVTSGFPSLAEVLAGLTQTQTQLNTLTEQASSGFIADTYGGLGATAPVALSLAPSVATLQVSQTNIAAASGPAQITQTAMTQIQTIASNLLAAMPSLDGVNPTAVDTAAASARSALTQLANLLDEQYGGNYVFAGQDTANPPVPNPDQILTSGFYTQISAAVGALSSNGAAATEATTLSVAASNAAGTSPFSPYLSQPVANLALPAVSTGDGQQQSLGLYASANSYATSAGNSTTGSYMRDLMRALATVGSMTDSQVNDPDFASLVQDTQSSLTAAITAMSTDVGILGQQQASLTTTSTTLSDTQTVLTAQLGSAQDVDMATTLTNLSLTQTRLQASYQLIATASGLSLAKFLPAA
jgi:flagellar hook-associated protein 3 FlgL